MDLLFIHHSCGGQLLADPGPANGVNCLYKTHPNGGGLRALLEHNGYVVHEASYGSSLGRQTDIFDWPPKFRDHMQQVLACDSQDVRLPVGRQNRIVVFKSCFPNNQFRSQGTPPGNPKGPALTVWNAKAAYRTLLPEFSKQPYVLFACMTAPPLAHGDSPPSLLKSLATILRGLSPVATASLARQFNNWLSAPEGWLKDYPARNVVVFDLFDILTGGRSDFCAYASSGGDSHPNREGNEKAAEAFVAFLEQAVARITSRRSICTETEKHGRW